MTLLRCRWITSASAPAWLSRVQTVFKRPATHRYARSPPRNWWHQVRKLWREISLLHSTGWSLDDALHEMTSVRSDVGNLLQLRARPPPPPQKPPPRATGQKGLGKSKGKDKGQKGKQSTQPGKRKTPGDGTAQEIKTSDLVQQHGNKTFCIRFNKGHCRNAQCKYLHA